MDCSPNFATTLPKETIKQGDQQSLIALFWELNYRFFAGVLPPLDLRFSGRLKTTGGQYFKRPKKLIQISTRYFQMKNPWQEIQDTLGHEMVHYWLDFQGVACGHNRAFYQKLRECGFNRYSRLNSMQARYLYTCPQCMLPYQRKKKGVWSCGPCSGPKFNPKFILKFIGEL